MTQDGYPQGKPLSMAKRLVETTHGGRSVETLLRAYDAAGWSQGRIAQELGVSRQAVNRWMQEYGVGRRVA